MMRSPLLSAASRTADSRHAPTRVRTILESARRSVSRARTAAVVALVAGGLLVMSASALAQTPSVGWSIDTVAAPSVFSSTANEECLNTAGLPAPECDSYHTTVTDAGSLASDGSAVEIKDVLPAGVEVQKVVFNWTGLPAETCEEEGVCGESVNLAQAGLCTTAGAPVTVTCR